MAGIIKLDDGSDIYASNMGLGGALEEIGASISDTDTRLAKWLVDVAKRPGGLMDFDLRGLSPTHRAAFWLGVDRADAKFSDWDQDASFSPTVGVIRLFGERREAREKSSQEHVPEIDLDEIWFDGETA